jgi:hypothetical protein
MRGTGRTNELTLANVVMSDARAEAGRAKFLSVGCNVCHANAGANAGFGDGGNLNFFTNVESVRHPDLAGFPVDGGFLSSPANADGSFGNRAFNSPPLIEAADTGPFFHTATQVIGASAHNTDFATTIEEAIAFYDTAAFNTNRGAPIDLTATEIDDMGRFLRGLNVTFNAAIAVKRLDAELAIIAEVPNLNVNSLLSLISAGLFIESARASTTELERLLLVTVARGLVVSASSSVGTNLTYNIAEGVVMF